MVVLVTCKNEEDPIKNGGNTVLTRLYVYFSDTQGQLTPQSVVGIWLKFKLIQAFMVILVTCKNEEDPIKNEGTRVLTRLYVDFSDTQGQLTRQSEVESG